MFVIFGTQFLGKVDCFKHGTHENYIATRFHHLMWMPLAYQGSYLVVDNKFAKRIAISWKSVACALCKAVLHWMLAFSLFMDFVFWQMPSQAEGMVTSMLIGAAIFFVLYISRNLPASVAQARKMGALIDNAPETFLKLGPTEIRSTPM